MADEELAQVFIPTFSMALFQHRESCRFLGFNSMLVLCLYRQGNSLPADSTKRHTTYALLACRQMSLWKLKKRLLLFERSNFLASFLQRQGRIFKSLRLRESRHSTFILPSVIQYAFCLQTDTTAQSCASNPQPICFSGQ